ncbi:phenylacetate--CoA ligase family protein [Roseivirga sp. BDSF3-8]|uniref:phenylacetate--CoA ligase family protein n=1 Tax=Roseivirga sp. BDSF3-8 TaxID=3241598 RepID=UPI0035321557
MKNVLLPIFQRLPGFVKNAATTWVGERRNKWRYTENSDRLIQEVAERDVYSKNEWATYQQERLDFILHRARHKVPYYKAYWDKRSKKGDTESWKRLENWPVLTKEEVRNYNSAFIAEDCDPKKMYTERTSGSTGKPVTVFWSRETTETYYAIFERRMRNWHGITRHDKYAMLGGQLINSANQTSPPFWVKNKAMNQLYMSCFHIAPQFVPHYARALRKYQPEYMYGYASSMYLLSMLVLEQGLEVPRLKAAISNAEFFFDYQQEAIRKAFNCQTINTYGMSELTAAGCTYGGQDIYLWPDVGIMEVMEYGVNHPVAEETKEGRFICTTLINPDMPFIRYEVGDGGVVQSCTADDKLHYKKITRIGGRIDDFIITSDDRYISRLDALFKTHELNIVEAQVIQEERDVFRILVVPGKGYSKEDRAIIESNFRKRVGEGKLTFQSVEAIPRTAAGKYKAIVSKIKKD